MNLSNTLLVPADCRILDQKWGVLSSEGHKDSRDIPTWMLAHAAVCPVECAEITGGSSCTQKCNWTWSHDRFCGQLNLANVSSWSHFFADATNPGLSREARHLSSSELVNVPKTIQHRNVTNVVPRVSQNCFCKNKTWKNQSFGALWSLMQEAWTWIPNATLIDKATVPQNLVAETETISMSNVFFGSDSRPPHGILHTPSARACVPACCCKNTGRNS